MAKQLRFFKEFLWIQPVGEMLEMLDQAEGDDIEVDLFTYGGETQPVWSLYKRIKNYSGNTKVEIDGIVASMGTVLAAAFKERGVSDTAKVMFHALSGELGNKTDEVRDSLYNSLSEIIDEEKFLSVAGIKLKDLMYQKGDEKKDIWLNAKQLKKIGFATYTYSLTPKKARNVYEAINNNASYNKILNMAEISSKMDNINNNQNKKVMTYDEFKQNHPSLFETIRNEGIKAGVKQEQGRVKTAIAYIDIDKEAVLDILNTDKEADQAFQAQMSVKAIAQMKLEKLAKDEPGATDTDTINDKPKDEGNSEKIKTEADAMLKRFGIVKN